MSVAYLAPTAIRVVDPNETDVAGIDWTGALAGTDDTLASCAVSIVVGTCTLASTLTGTYGATASATITGNIAEVAISNATAGMLQLLFRATTTQGRILDETRTLQVQSR